jgi:hypothetical protein
MVLALSAVAGCTGLVGASHASAKTLGTISLRINEDNPSANAHWGQAWDVCRAEYPATRSIHHVHSRELWNPTNPGDIWWELFWDCDDKP